MPKNALVAISPRPGSSTEQVARQWIVTFAELFCVSLKERGSRFVDLWVATLSDLPAEILDAACKRAMQVCKFCPTPAEIRGLIAKADSNGLQIEAAQAWERALSVAEHDGRGYGALDAPTQHAIRAAGGLTLIESCPRDELQWARKRFLEDYALVHETQQAENLLSDGDAKKIIRQLTAQSKRKPRELAPVTVPAATEK